MMKAPLTQKIHNLHSDQGGQSIIFVALVLFTLVSFMALVINVGHRTVEKVEMQNGTDAAALSGGTWIARGLNTICILNVSMTEILAWIIFLQAFKKTADVAKATYPANLAAATALCAIPFTAPAGCPWLTYLTSVAGPFINSVMSPAAAKVPPTVLKLWSLMRSCRKAEDVIKITAGAMSGTSAISIAEKNISNLATYIFPVLFPVGTMPTKVGTFKDICTRTHDGGPGYDNFFDGTAPIDMEFLGMPIKDWFALIWLPAVLMVPPPPGMYPLFVELESNSLCPGSGKKSFQRQVFTTSCNECDTKGYKMVGKKRVTVPGKSTWQGGVYEVINENKSPEKNRGLVAGNIIRVSGKTYNGRNFGEVNFTGGSPTLKGESTVGEDSALYPHSWCAPYSAGTCDTYAVPTVDDPPAGAPVRTTAVTISTTQAAQKTEYVKGGAPCTVTQYYQAQRTYYVWIKQKIIPLFEDPKNPTTPTGYKYEEVWDQREEFRYYKEQWSMTKCLYEVVEKSKPQNTSKRPRPLVLSDDWEKETNYLAFVFKNVEDQLTLGSATGGGNAKANYAMAQVKIYNATGNDDLFNQDWHAKLTPVNLSQVKFSVFGARLPLPKALQNFLSNAAGVMVVH